MGNQLMGKQQQQKDKDKEHSRKTGQIQKISLKQRRKAAVVPVGARVA